MIDYSEIDSKIINEIRELNNIGIETFFSCSGHLAANRDGAPLKRCARGLTNNEDCPYVVMAYSQELLEVLADVDTQLVFVDVEVWRLHSKLNGRLTLILRGIPHGVHTSEYFAFALRYVIDRYKKLHM